jgi:hypothetical protein
MSVVDLQDKADLYHSQFFGGRHCARITVPIITVDQIRAAAIELRALADDLDRAASGDGSTLAKVLEARAHISRASTKLKGGVHYRGAR